MVKSCVGKPTRFFSVYVITWSFVYYLNQNHVMSKMAFREILIRHRVKGQFMSVWSLMLILINKGILEDSLHKMTSTDTSKESIILTGSCGVKSLTSLYFTALANTAIDIMVGHEGHITWETKVVTTCHHQLVEIRSDKNYKKPCYLLIWSDIPHIWLDSWTFAVKCQTVWSPLCLTWWGIYIVV